MPPEGLTRSIELHKALSSKPPRQITQEAFDYNDEHLRRLARLSPGDVARASDLWEYTQDLLYTDIQSDLFVFLLPFCLEAWRQDLLGISQEYGGFVEHLYSVLANRHVFDEHLKSAQTIAVSQFMRLSILEEIRNQCGLSYERGHERPYRWLRAMTSYGVLLPDLNQLWKDWWAITSTGSAIAAVQYVACLMYAMNENPVFAPWTPDKGGGPPCLWEFEGHLYTNRWLETNVTFLEQTLSPKSVSDLLARAVEKLIGQPEHKKASEVLADLPLCSSTLENRCARLPQILRTVQQPGVLFDW